VSTLIAALRSDNPLGGAPLSYAEADDSFSLQGVGEIDAAKLLDLENRRQLVWADPVTREWALELAAIRLRKEKEAAAKAAAWAAEAAAAAAAQAAAEATAAPPPADAAGGVAAADVGATAVYDPPTVAGRRPAGIRATQTRFAAPDKDAVRGAGGRVVWAEPPADEPDDRAKVAETAAAVAAAWAAADPLAAGAAGPDASAAAGTAGGAGAGWSAASPGFAAAVQAGPIAPAPPGANVVTRRTDRRSARREAEHRRASGAAWVRILLYVMIAVAVAVVLLLMQQGTIGF